MSQHHPAQSIFYYFSVLLERMAYYGMRGILILYFMSELAFSQTTSIETYAKLSAYTMIGYVLGGVVGLLNQPKWTTIAGFALQGVGALGFLLDPSLAVIGYLLGIIAFGAAVTRVNGSVFLGKLYGFGKGVDTAVIIQYIVINLGATIGVVLISYFADAKGFTWSFAITAVLFFMAGGLLAFATDEQEITESEERDHSEDVFDQLGETSEAKQNQPISSYSIVLITLLAVLSIIYWLFLESTGGELIYYLDKVGEGTAESYIDNISVFNGLVIVIFGLILIIFFRYKNVRTHVKAIAGIVLCFIGIIPFFFLFSIQDAGILLFSLIVYQLFYSMAEVLLIPLYTAVVVRKVKPQYAALVLGGLSCLIGLSISSGGQFLIQDVSSVVAVTAFALALIGVGVWLNFKYNSDS